MNIHIYSKSNCPNCVAAKNLLKLKGLEYTEFDADIYDAELIAKFEKLGVRQFPQIFIDDQRVGGLAGLQAALKQLEGK